MSTGQQRKWTAEEIELVSDPNISVLKIQQLTGRSRASVSLKRFAVNNPGYFSRTEQRRRDRSQIGAVNSYRPWTSVEVKELRETIDRPVPEVARKLGRSYQSIAGARHRFCS